MDEQDRDWLDERIAVDTYIPDDGFTAKVVQVLPRAQPDRAGVARRRILALFTFLALCLLAAHLIPVLRGANSLAAYYYWIQEQVAVLAHQPMVIYGTAGGLLLLAFVSIPFLRRWA